MTKRDDLLAATRRASEVINSYNVRERIADGYTRIDPALIASEADVTVIYRPFERILGAFIREDGASGIIVNVARPRGLVHMTCAHELGHYFLGHESVADETVEYSATSRLIEQQADHFAYSLLAPRWLVVATMRMKGWNRSDLETPFVVYQLSLRLGISFTAMVWSLVRLQLLSDDTAERVAKCTPKRLKQEALNGLDLTDARSDVWVLDASDRDRILEPGYGDQFVIDLPNHAGSGHLWSGEALESEGFTLRPFVHDARRTPRSEQDKHVIVGGDGAKMRYVLHPPESVRERGQTSYSDVLSSCKRHTISLQETIPWLSKQELSDRLSLNAEFDAITDGFSHPERERRLAAVREIQ
ncbi:MAG: ImmA/IrrE family metallo-endopeptidase [Ferrimicrobium acidiphilum]